MCTIRKTVNDVLEKIEGGQWVILQVYDDLFNLSIFYQGSEDSKHVDSIIACLAQLMLDSHYRSAVGLLKLLCKDWFGEGYGVVHYKISNRC